MCKVFETWSLGLVHSFHFLQKRRRSESPSVERGALGKDQDLFFLSQKMERTGLYVCALPFQGQSGRPWQRILAANAISKAIHDIGTKPRDSPLSHSDKHDVLIEYSKTERDPLTKMKYLGPKFPKSSNGPLVVLRETSQSVRGLFIE